MDLIFKALGDPARREILDALRAEDGQTLSQLEPRFEMTRFGVMKHLGVLEDAGLITTIKRGRYKHHYLNALPLQEVIDRWLEPLLIKPTARGVLALKSQLEETAMLDATPKPDFVMQTYITCSLDALWTALTDVSVMAAYQFHGATIRREGDVLHMVFPDGAEMLRCRDIEITPKTRIERSFEPLWQEGVPASRYVYTIREEGRACSLTVTHYDLPAEISEGVGDGWARELSGLKTWLETGNSVYYNEENLTH